MSAVAADETRRAWLYLRISRDEAGDEMGVRRQESALTELVVRNGWKVAGVFCDNDQSAYGGRDRVGYKRLLASAQSGDVVACTEITRLTRHPRELEDLVQFVEANNITIVALRAGQIDLQTSGGRAFARMLGTFSRMESEQLGERVSAKHRQNAKAGRAHGGPVAFGYRRTGPGQLEIDDAQAAVIRWAAAEVLRGATIDGLVKDLNERSVPSARGGQWRPSSLGLLLRSPGIAALRTAGGEVIGDAAWPAIIDRPTHERLLARLNHSPVGPRPRRNVLAGLIYCGKCNGRMKGRSEGKSGDRGRQYACDKVAGGCGSCSASADRVEEYVVGLVVGTAATIDMRAVRARRAVGDTGRLVEQLADDEQLLKDLAADHGSRTIGRAEWLAAREPVLARIADARSTLGRIEEPAIDDSTLGGLDLERWELLSFDQRRAVIALFVERVVIAKGAKTGRSFDFGRITVDWRL